jgi:O-antigen/teichoic acid export membrane protein
MDLLSYSWPLSFHESLRILSRYVTLFIIGILLSGADVGLYSSALNIAVLLSVFLVITQPSFFTTATHMDDLSSLFRTVTKALLVLTIPLFVVGVLHADDLLWIVFGSAFVEATPVLVVLLCALGFEVFTGPVERYLNTKGYSKHVMVNMVVSTVVTVLGSVALIPGYGIVGAAVANAVAIVIQRVLGLVEAYVLTGLVPYTSEAVSVAAAGSVLAVGTTLASYSSIVVEAVVFTTLLTGYLCSVWLVALTTEERSWLRSLTETFLT